MRYFLKYIIIFLFAMPAFGQGFNWQYSARMPAESPTIFVGVASELSYISHSGDFRFLEQETTCCKYESGAGAGYVAGLTAESWLSPGFALNFRINMSSANARFTSRNSVAKDPQTLLVTEYAFESSVFYFNGEAAAKWRIAGLHFFGGVSLKIGAMLHKTNVFTESIISPENEYFNTSPPSQQRNIPLGHVPDIMPLSMSPGINVGYDFTFGRGLYASVFAAARFNALNVIREERWRRWSLSVGINIFKGIR
jgi:hypothetical protein